MSYREKKEHARLQEEDKERTERLKILEVLFQVFIISFELIYFSYRL
jgi:hypothetical protein